MKKQSCTFEEDYFEEYFKKEITEFSESGFNRMHNWFRGIFKAINGIHNIQNGKGKTAIEFGCALGAASRVLSDFGYQVTATDVSNYAVKKAKKFSSNIKFIQQDIQEQLKTKEYFDLVVAFDVIEHLEQPEKAIKNMFHLVKKGGLVICSTPNDYEYARKIPSHVNVKDPLKWRELFKKAGFKQVKTYQRTFIPFLYRLHWGLNFALPFGINFEQLCSPVFIIAEK